VNYEIDDILRVVRVPYMMLLRPGPALHFLRRQAAKVEAWGTFLPRYNTIVCEPLEFAYDCLRCLGALDVLLLQDLFSEIFTYRGIVMGAFLSALEPRPEFRELLLQARPKAPKNQWIVDIAVATIDGIQPEELSEHFALIARIRCALAPIPRPAMKLTPYDQAQHQLFLSDAAIVREIYKTQGREATLAHLASHPRRVLLPSSLARGNRGRHETNPPWDWGMTPPCSTEDLMSWRPSLP
jgi:hypothetical protein